MSTKKLPAPGEPCPKCDYVHDPAKCQGHVVKDPDTRQPMPPRQCRKPPVKGGRTCATHGSARGTNGAAAAEQRLANDKAERELQALWAGLGQQESIKDPYAALAELGGSLRAMTEEAGQRVSAMRHLAGGEHLTQLRAEALLFDKSLGRYQAVLDSLGRLDVSGRHLALQQQKAEINREIADTVMLATNVALAALFQARPDLLPEDRLLFLTTFTGRLGAAPDDGPVPELLRATTDDPAAVPDQSTTNEEEA